MEERKACLDYSREDLAYCRGLDQPLDRLFGRTTHLKMDHGVFRWTNAELVTDLLRTWLEVRAAHAAVTELEYAGQQHLAPFILGR